MAAFEPAPDDWAPGDGAIELGGAATNGEVEAEAVGGEEAP